MDGNHRDDWASGRKVWGSTGKWWVSDGWSRSGVRRHVEGAEHTICVLQVGTRPVPSTSLLFRAGAKVTGPSAVVCVSLLRWSTVILPLSLHVSFQSRVYSPGIGETHPRPSRHLLHRSPYPRHKSPHSRLTRAPRTKATETWVRACTETRSPRSR